MKYSELFYTSDRTKWRDWLETNSLTKKEVWFVFPNSKSSEEALPYNDAVEEALCFGWIDSTAGKLDDLHQVRRFGPRKEGSEYSRSNIERLIWLNEKGLIKPHVLDGVERIISKPYVFPTDIIEELKKDELVWQNFNNFSDPYKRIRVEHINSARKDEFEFKKRLSNFIEKTKANKLIIGFGGIEKYYK